MASAMVFRTWSCLHLNHWMRNLMRRGLAFQSSAQVTLFSTAFCHLVQAPCSFILTALQVLDFLHCRSHLLPNKKSPLLPFGVQLAFWKGSQLSSAPCDHSEQVPVTQPCICFLNCFLYPQFPASPHLYIGSCSLLVFRRAQCCSGSLVSQAIPGLPTN